MKGYELIVAFEGALAVTLPVSVSEMRTPECAPYTRIRCMALADVGYPVKDGMIRLQQNVVLDELDLEMACVSAQDYWGEKLDQVAIALLDAWREGAPDGYSAVIRRVA